MSQRLDSTHPETSANFGTRQTRKVSVSQLSVVLAALGGCASTGSQNEACLAVNSIPTGVANCIQAYDVKYSYANGKRPERAKLAAWETPGVEANYVAQLNDNHCYAAALSIAFKSQGIPIQQDVFSETISNACFGTGRQPLSFSQILYAATRANGRNGVWYIDRPDNYFSKVMNAFSNSGVQSSLPAGATTSERFPILPGTRRDVPVFVLTQICQSRHAAPSKFWFSANVSPLALIGLGKKDAAARGAMSSPSLEAPEETKFLEGRNLYADVYWTKDGSPPGRKDGQYLPLADPQDVIEKMVENRATILAGMSGGGAGHVVVVSKIVFAIVDVNGGWAPHPAYYVATVEVADPAMPDAPIQIYSGDQFFKQARFLMALLNNRKGS